MGLAIHLLGRPRAEQDGKALPTPRGHKVWGLLAYLIRSDAGVSRTHLAGLLFEDADDPLAASPSTQSATAFEEHCLGKMCLGRSTQSSVTYANHRVNAGTSGINWPHA